MNMNQYIFQPRYVVYKGALIVIVTFLSIVPIISEAATAANPHWRKGSCDVCHQSAQPTASQHSLKTASTQEVCGECHGKKGSLICRHRSGFATDANTSTTIGDSLISELENGRVVCTTCHDMTPHCSLDIKQRYRNSSFLRDGPFNKRGDQCFECHSKSGYRQRSPHMHISKGEIKEGHCIFCHDRVPQQDATGQWMPVEYSIKWRLSQLCSGCHNIGPHPSGSISGKTGWIHMVVPPPHIAVRMQQAVDSRGGSLPLDPNTGEITCTTCHNPHNRKLEAYPRSGEKTKTKLRYTNMCEVCHDK